MERNNVDTVYIRPTDRVVLSKQKICLRYGTMTNFAKMYGIDSRVLRTWCNKPTYWKKIIDGSNKPISKKYIDWEKTKFYIVDPEVKSAMKLVDEYEGEENTWI